jgi:hypothetical protein
MGEVTVRGDVGEVKYPVRPTVTLSCSSAALPSSSAALPDSSKDGIVKLVVLAEDLGYFGGYLSTWLHIEAYTLHSSL